MFGSLLAGMFLFNSIPHLVMGISGKTHMTPFKRVSSPQVNVLWAFTNIVVSVLFLGFDSAGKVNIPSGNSFWSFMLGALLMSLMAANLFGKPNARLPWHKD